MNKKPKIRVLFLAANPDSATRLELGREFNKIRDAIARAQFRAAFQLIPPEFNAQIETISAALISYRPHVVHFAGHGSQSQGLVLEDRNHRTILTEKAELTALLKQLRRDIRLVFLNACYTEEQAQMLKKIFDYTIGSDGLIEDRCAAEFARAFYRHLAEGATVREAFLASQFGIKNCGPVMTKLLKRAGVRDNRSFVDQVTKQLVKGPKSQLRQPSSSQAGIENYGEIGTFINGSTLTINMQQRER